MSKPISYPVNGNWKSWGYPPKRKNGADFVYENKDWSNAIGSFGYKHEGEVVVKPPENKGDDWSYEVKTKPRIKKLYNWERNSENPALGSPQNLIFDYSQKDLSNLHKYGVAKEYWIEGVGDYQTQEG